MNTRQWLAAIPLILGLSITWSLWSFERRLEFTKAQDGFEFTVNRMVDQIRTRLALDEQLMGGVRELFVLAPGTSDVSRETFREFVLHQRAQQRMPGMQAIGFVKAVNPKQLTVLLQQIHAEGFTDYAIQPATPRDFYTAIVYNEPDNVANRRAFGFDMYTDTTRRAAMDRARNENVPAMSGKVHLRQEGSSDVQAGFTMLLPIYRPKSGKTGASQVGEDFIGWISAAFRMNDFISGVFQYEPNQIGNALRLTVVDADDEHAGEVMFDSNSYSGSTVSTRPSLFTTTRVPTLFGHRWFIRVSSLPEFETRQMNHTNSTIILVSGMLISLLVTWVIWLQMNGRQRAVVLARKMNLDLEFSQQRQIQLNRSLRLLGDCNLSILQSGNEFELLQKICQLCVDSGGYQTAWVGYAEHDEMKSVRSVAQSGIGTKSLNDLTLSWGDGKDGRGLVGGAIRSRSTVVEQNIADNENMQHWQELTTRNNLKSGIALPLVVDDHVLGCLTIYAKETHSFDVQEIKLLEEMVRNVVFGVQTLRSRFATKVVQERVEFLTNFDTLTGLPNRLLLRERFSHAVDKAQETDRQAALVLIDLDHFRHINESLGHNVGDQVLLDAAKRIRKSIPNNATLSRPGGDEFIVLLPQMADAPAIAAVARDICSAFVEPFHIADAHLHVAPSIGISLFPSDGLDFDMLLQCADMAMYRAKEEGRNTYRFFDRSMNAYSVDQLNLAGSFVKALRNDEFVLHYQPQIDSISGAIVGAEALIRWNHPEQGLLYPARFIGLSEHSGHIVPIGQWAIHEACQQARLWKDMGQPMVVAVNLSAIQFRRGEILRTVTTALHETGLPPELLELELTESILLQDATETLEVLHELSMVGVKLSIDDFGTGYSSLAYLKQLPVNQLKIDQSFVRDMLSSSDGASIVNAIVQLGHNLQLEVIAEGVETEQQRTYLESIGCEKIQGYLISRPLPSEEFRQLLEKQK